MGDATPYDLLVIGAGQSGAPLAGAFSKAGHRVALVERAHIGGTCVNWGCTPTKTMLASGRVAHLARRAGDYGVQTDGIAVDMPTVRQRQRDMVSMFRGGSERGIEQQANIDLYRGEATFVDDRTVAVSQQDGEVRRLAGERVLINTGTRPRMPDVPGLREVRFLDSTSVMELDHVPDHLLVLGGGYIGLEFAQLFRRLGSDVTLVQRREQILPREDSDIAACLQGILRDEGIDLRLNTSVASVEPSDGQIAASLNGRDGRDDVLASHLLIAAGRVPNTDTLNLEATGVATNDRGYVTVDNRLRTSAANVYASGDVHGGPAFTHTSYDDFRLLKGNLLRGEARTTAGRIVANTVFTDPQLGRVGLSEHEARGGGYDVSVASMPMTSVPRALETDETRGMMKAVVDRSTNRILGAGILGIEGGELASMIQVAMQGDMPYTTLRDAPFAHPTLAESLNNLFGQV